MQIFNADDDDLIFMEYNNIDWNSNFLSINNNDDDDFDALKYQFEIEQRRRRMFESSSSSSSPSTTNVTFDDIEKLSIRIAEHALEING